MLSGAPQGAQSKHVAELTDGIHFVYPMNVRIARWGNSLAVRIPKDAIEAAGLHDGDVLDLVSEGHNIVLVPRGTLPNLDALVALITPENRHTEAFAEPIGAEIW